MSMNLHNLSSPLVNLCFSSVPQRRFRSSRMVLSSKSFSLLGNRRAVCVDYLPVLRFICHTLTTQQHKGELGRWASHAIVKFSLSFSKLGFWEIDNQTVST